MQGLHADKGHRTAVQTEHSQVRTRQNQRDEIATSDSYAGQNAGIQPILRIMVVIHDGFTIAGRGLD